MPKLNPKDIPLLLGIIVVINALAFASSMPVMTAIDHWYNDIEKSCLTPPNWVFAPVWTFLYSLIGIAAWRIWKKRSTVDVRPALGLFVLQLVFNFIWTPLFFGAQEFTIAFIDITILAVLIAANIRLFLDIDAWAGRLMMPYLLWVGFASYLNGYIAYMN